MSGFCLYLKACLTVTVANPIHRPNLARVTAALSLPPLSPFFFACYFITLTRFAAFPFFPYIFFASTTALCLCTDAVQEESPQWRESRTKNPRNECQMMLVSVVIFESLIYFLARSISFTMLYSIGLIRLSSGLYLFVPLV
ncbi:hypothetical protein BC827DRAFT_884166 [Russula dissimulans]|nr:hypothetical protein BC827DRAFT_884166 [Russula dissimulans]